MEPVTQAALDELRQSVGTLPVDLRRALAREWARAAQFEHASIASFSRFSLELLAVGAPAELLESTHRAAQDEITHARLSFALASLYAGSPVGPGALPMQGAEGTSFELGAIAASTAAEGCVSETLAALEAEVAAEAAEPSALRQILGRIAKDEAEHAALAFRFVRWALLQGGAELRGQVERSYRTALDSVRREAPLTGPLDAELLRHGRLVGDRRQAIRKAALGEVLEPALDDLLGRSG
jgi:hypothetical protein